MQSEVSRVHVGAAGSLVAFRPLQLIAAFLLGGSILYAAAFLNTAAAHNAAHDTRHSFGFPCH